MFQRLISTENELVVTKGEGLEDQTKGAKGMERHSF